MDPSSSNSEFHASGSGSADSNLSSQTLFYYSYPYPAFQPAAYAYASPYVAPLPRTHAPAASKTKLKTPPPVSTPSPPPPETYRHWDQLIYSFLSKLGLHQAVAGFEADLLIMNATWEQKTVPGALSELAKGISINKDISQFLARNRARNDASNRAEFVYTLAQKRQKLAAEGLDMDPSPSCARTDAKPLDRDVQMTYDIAKNEEGPLSRTMHGESVEEIDKVGNKGNSKMDEAQLAKIQAQGDAGWTKEQHPGLDERLSNIETHLAVRYVPSPPRTLLARLKYLEEHLIRLEKDYPPWAALHFNQPNRGWPPPPRQTPIIVPPHLRDGSTKETTAASAAAGVDQTGRAPEGKQKQGSSLYQAVMQRLQVKQALSDLTGASE
ncbi:hypothetical protein H0H81_012424 [Sphagnurus paluster]|uniref:Uncharacterized protein n=1 Tax=Sphagnurus paluster TaxID=117069 RepID=A0A9P7GNX3_9AGAR|nr:hypothetical protein H0H81_012424 [Sphagnurus paluster]